MTMSLIATTTLTSSELSIEFTSVPQTFTDLKLVLSLRGTDSDAASFPVLIFNGISTGSSIRTLSGNGSVAASQSIGAILFVANGATSTANTFGNAEIYIPNYTASTNKSLSIDSVSENNATVGLQYLIAGDWSNTSSITTLRITNTPNSFVAGSTISLYGITKGSDGIVTTS